MGRTITRRLLLMSGAASALVVAFMLRLWRRLGPSPPRTDDTAKGGDDMSEPRAVKTVIKGRPTIEGAGVHLQRLFGFGDESAFDPFLLMDHFGSDKREDYAAGFPWHPHRGMETITYVLEGEVTHMDSLGNEGTIGAGDLQWMTAGAGIIHQEMPKGDAGERMSGFQLWANLPKTEKMTAPKYRDIRSDRIPSLKSDNGVEVKVIAGRFNGTEGPMDDIVIQPEYLDIRMPPEQTIAHATPRGHTVFAYVFEGSARFGTTTVDKGHIALFSDGDTLDAAATGDGARFLLVSGKPLGEPIAWRGPIVMNTEAELHDAFEQYRNGTFVKR